MSEREPFLEEMENQSGCCEYDEPEEDDDMGADTQGNAYRSQGAVPSQLSALADAQFDGDDRVSADFPELRREPTFPPLFAGCKDAQFEACMDRLHLLLAAHFSALGVTAISQIQERK